MTNAENKIDKIRMRVNNDGDFVTLHPETDSSMVLLQSGQTLDNYLTVTGDNLPTTDLRELAVQAFQRGNSVKSELISLIQSKGFGETLTADSTFEDVIAVIDESGLGAVGDVIRISHNTPAPTSQLISLEMNKSITTGDAYDNITLVNETAADNVNLVSSKTITGYASGSAFSSDTNILNILVSKGLIPNKDYKGEIPVGALKDSEGNDVAGAYVFRFKTKSVIAESGKLLNLESSTDGESVTASWTNPADVDLVKITAKRNQTGYLNDINGEGVVVYDELGTTFTDIDVVEDNSYFYTLFAVDSIGEYNAEAKFQIEVKSVVIVIVTPEVSMADLSSAIAKVPDDTEILFTEGTYLMDSQIKITRGNIRLKAEGNVILRRNFEDGTDTLIDVRGTSAIGNITISDFTIDGNKDNFTTNSRHGIVVRNVGSDTIQGITIKGNRIINNTYYGIDLASACNNCAITNNTIANNSNIGLLAYTCKNSIISENIVRGNGTDGIYVGPSSTKITINGNVIESSTRHGILLSSPNNVTVTGNTFISNASVAINILSSNNNTITGNVVRGSSLGVSLSSSSGNTITGNTLLDNSTYAVVLTLSNNNIICANTVYPAASKINISNSDCKNNLVCSNNTPSSSVTNSGTGSKLAHNITT